MTNHGILKPTYFITYLEKVDNISFRLITNHIQSEQLGTSECTISYFMLMLGMIKHRKQPKFTQLEEIQFVSGCTSLNVIMILNEYKLKNMPLLF